MKLSRIITIALLMGGISTLAVGCGPKAATSTTTTQVVTAGRGNLSLAITAVGNLALSQTEDLAFEIPGTVQAVPVSTGDSVRKGQVLATLDTSTWDTTLTQLDRAVTSAQRKVTSTQLALRNAQNAIVTAQNTVISKQLASRSAQLNYQSDNDSLYQIAAVKTLQDSIDNYQAAINLAQSMLYAGQDFNQWTAVKNASKTAMAQAQADLKALLAGTSITASSDSALAIAKAQLKLDQDQLGINQAQLDLQNAQVAVGDAQNAIAPAQEDVKNAQDDLKTAQKSLDDARSNNPEVTAPFDGFVTNVSVKGGDVVQKGKVAVTIADPTKVNAVVMVNETDISKITPGQFSTIVPQAASSTTYSANVTQIAPTATIQQGVVNYQVTVGVQSLEPIGQALRQSTGNATSGNPTSSNATPGRQGAGGGQGFGGGAGFPGGNLTQSQIQAIQQQRAQAGGGGFGGGFTRGSQTATTTSPTFALASGMTVTVTIPYQTRTNVILVPNAAITTSGGQSSVKIVSADNTTASRVIQTGISDSQNTEVTSGLSLGEKVQITRTTTTGTGTSRATTPTGGGIPGLGGGGGVFRVGG